MIVKKLLILFLFIVFCLMIVNKIVPQNKLDNSQYIQEINQVIDIQVPITKNNIDRIEQEIKEETDPNIKQVIVEQGVNEELFKFYMELINTTKKYVKINKTMPITDWHGDLQKYINPTLEQNKVDTSKIEGLLKYAYEKEEYFRKTYAITNQVDYKN